MITLIVLPTGLWRLAMVCGFPSGYIEAGSVPFAPGRQAVDADAERRLLGAITVSYYRRTRRT
ncbi:hypothetical protein [Streptomyces sp. NPDC054995]